MNKGAFSNNDFARGFRWTVRAWRAWSAAVAFMGAATTTMFAADEPDSSTARSAMRAEGRHSAAVRFQNGDTLLGWLESIQPEQGLRWRRSDAVGPIDFKLDRLADVQFLRFEPGPAPTTNSCIVQLRNHDRLPGELVTCDERQLVLATRFAGTLTIPRNQVAGITPLGANPAAIFEGPDGLEGWTQGRVTNTAIATGQWTFRNRSFYAQQSASIARDVRLPDMASIRFDLAWKNTFHLAVALYTAYLHPVSLAAKEKEPPFGGFYSLQLNTSYANLLSVRQTDPLRYLGVVSVPAFAQKNRAQIEVRINKSKNLIALLVDGELIKQWFDTEEFSGTGTGIRFVHQGVGQVRMSNLRVSQWDGHFDELARTNQVVETEVPDADHLRLRNGDRVAGKLESIRQGLTTVDVNGTRLPIPLSRLRQIDLAETPGVTRAKLEPTVRVALGDDLFVTIQLVGWSPEKLSGQHPILGPLSIVPSACQRIRFRDLTTASATP